MQLLYDRKTTTKSLGPLDYFMRKRSKELKGASGELKASVSKGTSITFLLIDVLNVLDKSFGVSCVTQGDNIMSSELPSANLVTMSSSVPTSYSTKFLMASCNRMDSAISSMIHNNQLGNLCYARLRIAECCIMAKERGHVKPCELQSDNSSEVRVRVIGQGKWRQLVTKVAFIGDYIYEELKSEYFLKPGS
ncbi:hypothetical protein ACFE04_009808 [Oxalis oulophora]